MQKLSLDPKLFKSDQDLVYSTWLERYYFDQTEATGYFIQAFIK